MSEIKIKKILYIEDDPETRSLIGDIFRYKGYTYFEADRGLDGIKLAKTKVPDLIIVDLILPDMQGYEVTTHLKSIDELRDIPIVALTGQTNKDIRELTLTAGCVGYITKPINVTEFLFKIEEYLTGRKDNVAPEKEKLFLQKYNAQLVEKLRTKLIELEISNDRLSRLNVDLFNSREEFARYNDWLFYLNNLANTLGSYKDPYQMLKILPSKMTEGFKLDRCILFELNTDKNTLLPYSFSGVKDKANLKKKYKVSTDFLDLIRDENGMLWVKDPKELVEKSMINLAASLDSTTFILGIFSHFSPNTDSTKLLRSIAQDVDLDHKLDTMPKRYLIFIDKHQTDNPFVTYEIRILKAFIQTISIIFENMVLYYDLVKLFKLKEKQAITDGLTQLYNYRYFINEIAREIKRSSRFKTSFSLLLIDLDRFKELNDKLGHLKGDEVLHSIGKLLKSNTRSIDTVARYGGEEFAIIVPGTQKENAFHLADKLRQIVEDHQFSGQKKLTSKKLTLSVGVASFPEDGKEAKEVIQNADQALYKAKDSGRNRVIKA